MVDPTSDAGRLEDESAAPTCVVCGDRIVEDPDHRVVTWVEDGEIRVRDFCGEADRDAWLAAHDVPGWAGDAQSSE